MRRAQLALFEGRLGEAEDAIREAFALGHPVQSVNAQLAFDLQLYALRREQGRIEEVVDAVERAADEYPTYPVWRYVVADCFVELGRADAARAAVADAAVGGYPVYLEMQWLFSLNLLAGVCRFLGDAAAADDVYDRLRPYAHRFAVLPPELCHGSVSRGLGILAATTSRWEDAARHFEDALVANAAADARTWLAHTEYDYARMLLERGEAGDRTRAAELLASARKSADELGMAALAARLAAPARA